MIRDIYKKITKSIKKNVNFHEIDLRARRIRFLYTFSVIGAIFFIGFGLINLFKGNYISGIYEHMIGLFFIINLIAMKYSRNLKIAFVIVLLLMITFYTYILIEGGIANSGIFWFFVFPIISFFLLGIKGGIRWIAYLFIVLVFLMILNQIGIIRLAFSNALILMVIAALFLVSLLIYAYESAHEYSTDWLSQQKDKFKALNDNLETEIKARKKAEKESQLKLMDAEKLNQLMIGRELKIAELKKQMNKVGIKDISKDK